MTLTSAGLTISSSFISGNKDCNCDFEIKLISAPESKNATILASHGSFTRFILRPIYKRLVSLSRSGKLNTPGFWLLILALFIIWLILKTLTFLERVRVLMLSDNMLVEGLFSVDKSISFSSSSLSTSSNLEILLTGS